MNLPKKIKRQIQADNNTWALPKNNRLFLRACKGSDKTTHVDLKLIKAKPFPTGMVLMRYAVDNIRYGLQNC